MSAVKLYVQSILKHAGIYQRVKASAVYDLYWGFANRQLIKGRDSEVKFYRNLPLGFQRGDTIFDIGANAGEKTDVFLRVGARVVAVEPDERNQEILRGKYLEHRMFPNPVVIVGQAVSDEVGFETMWIDEPGAALNTLSQKWAETLKGDKKRFEHTRCKLEFTHGKSIKTTTLEQLMITHGLPFFVKIDVEGYELNVLRGLRRSVPYLSFEINLPEFRQEGLECIEVLLRLDSAGQFNYASNCKQGLALDRWVDSRQISQTLDRCGESCIEVFWRAPVARCKNA